MIQTLFFDLGGVVFRDFFSGAVTEFAQKLGLPAETVLAAYVKTDVPVYCKNLLDDEERWKLFVDELHLPEAEIEPCIESFYESYQLFPQTVALLQELLAMKRYRFGVLSDQPMGVAQYLRNEHQNVFDLFASELVIISAEIGLSKRDPDLEIYKEAIRKSGDAADKILLVDNALHNIENAKSLGMQTYYFDIEHKPIEELIKELKEVINSLSQ